MRMSPPVRMNRSGGGRSASATRGRTGASSMSSGCSRPAATSSASARAARGDVLAAAVAGGDGQVQRACCRAVSASAASMRARIACAKRSRSPMKRMRTPRRCSSVDFALERVQEQLHQRADFVFRAAPVLAGKREQRQRLDAVLEAEVDAQVDRARAGAMADDARAAARCAQRPLPSMMTARWRGMRVRRRRRSDSCRPSDRHQLLFLGLDHFVDVLDRLVGELLDVGFAARRLRPR